MAGSNPLMLAGAVEGLVDEAVLRRIADHIGASVHAVYGRNGKPALLQRLEGYNRAAQFSPWLVLLDLDEDDQCAPPYRVALLPRPAPRMCFRIAVRETEAWLLADRERLAGFLAVALSKIPSNPEGIRDPKRNMVDLARQSRRREIREDMVPWPGSGRTVGPAYTSRLIQFALDNKNGWRPEVAARSSDSLARCLRRLHGLVGAS